MTNEEYMKKVYDILDEWSVLTSTNIEDVYDAMKELERRDKALDKRNKIINDCE